MIWADDLFSCIEMTLSSHAIQIVAQFFGQPNSQQNLRHLAVGITFGGDLPLLFLT